MELAGFKDFQHLKQAEIGFKKGETPLTPARILRKRLQLREQLTRTLGDPERRVVRTRQDH